MLTFRKIAERAAEANTHLEAARAALVEIDRLGGHLVETLAALVERAKAKEERT